MQVIEFRIPQPLSLHELEKGILYSPQYIKKLKSSSISSNILKQGGLFIPSYVASNNDIIPPTNEARSIGLYTHSVYMIDKSLPSWIRSITGNNLNIEQRCYTIFPYIRTEYTCPIFDTRLKLIVQTVHIDNDIGEIENVFNLDENTLKQRKIEKLNIAAGKDNLNLPLNWCNEALTTKSCTYKIVFCEFNYWGLQNRIQDGLKDAYLKIHRGAYRWRHDYANIELSSLFAEEIQLIDLAMAPFFKIEVPRYNPLSLSTLPSHLPSLQQLEISPELPSYLQSKSCISFNRKLSAPKIYNQGSDKLVESIEKNAIYISVNNPFFQKLQYHHDLCNDKISKSGKTLDDILGKFESIINLKIAMMKIPPVKPAANSVYKWSMMALICYLIIRNRNRIFRLLISLFQNYIINLSD